MARVQAATASAPSTRRGVRTRRTRAQPIRKPGFTRRGDGQPTKLCYIGHALMENRHGLAVGGGISQRTGTAERETALALIDGRRRGRRRITLGADKAYNVEQFVDDLRDRSVTPHIAIDGHLSKTGTPRKTAVDGRTTRDIGYYIMARRMRPARHGPQAARV
jgi:hypothetical protein